jgi:hypothetical protein
MSELRKMTRMGGDIRKIARLLQDKGRNGDTILAHINPREAALLREQGGSGDINPETGLPEFSDWSEGSSGYDAAPPEPDYSSVPEGLFEGAAYTPDSTGYESVPEGLFEGAQYVRPEFGFAPVSELDLTAQTPQETFARRGAEAGVTPPDYSLAGVRTPTALGEPMAGPRAGPSQAPAEKGFLESLSGADKTRLGLAGIQGLSTALMARKAQAGAQRGAEQIRQVGAPYAQRGLAEQSAAQRGELTPVGQQQLDAMRARAAQAGVARGGVGVAQQQRAEEALRQRLNAARESFGLQLSQIGDKYTMDAIKAGMQADAEVNQLYNQMFGNLARIAAPAAIQAGAK